MRLLSILLVFLVISSCSEEPDIQNNIELELYEEILSVKEAIKANNANIKNLEEKVANIDSQFQYLNSYNNEISSSDLREQYNPFSSKIIPETINDISEDAVILIKDDTQKDADHIYSLTPNELRSKLAEELDEEN